MLPTRRISWRRAVDSVAVGLGLLAFVVQAIAPLCLNGIASQRTGGFPIVICTLHGSQTVTLDANGNPVPVSPGKDGSDSQCPMCAAFHAAPLLAPFAALLLAILFFSHYADRFVFVPARVARRAYTAFVTRGPPAALAA